MASLHDAALVSLAATWAVPGSRDHTARIDFAAVQSGCAVNLPSRVSIIKVCRSRLRRLRLALPTRAVAPSAFAAGPWLPAVPALGLPVSPGIFRFGTSNGGASACGTVAGLPGSSSLCCSLHSAGHAGQHSLMGLKLRKAHFRSAAVPQMSCSPRQTQHDER